MKPLREWIQDKIKEMETWDCYADVQVAFQEGFGRAYNNVLNELQAREDAEQQDGVVQGTPICEVPLLYEDARPITAIYWESEAGAEHTVGRAGVTKIVPYLDHTTLWFAVYQGDFLSRRVPAYEVCVLYANSGEEI